MSLLAPVPKSDLRSVLKLDPGPGMDNFVAPNAVTFAQSLYEPGSEIFGIYDGTTPVGLLAIVDMAHPNADLDDEDDPDGVYLWRLMVDQGRQRQGHGRAALDFCVSRARELGRKQIIVSAVPDAGTPIPFYKGYGFEETGRIVDEEVEMVLRLTT